jgi:apoptosis-inducing factor 3
MLVSHFIVRRIRVLHAQCVALTEGKRLVVVGSSFISMELIVAFSDRKLASIDVVSTEKYPFQHTLGDEVGIGLEKARLLSPLLLKILTSLPQHFVKQGIKFHLGVKVTAMRPSASDPKHAIGVELEGGGFIPADTIVTGVGVTPATGFLKSSGIPLETPGGGIKVDEFLRVPNFDGVYAVGDIATYPDTSGAFGRLEHWNVASNHGRAVGRHIMGKGEPFGKIPFAWSTREWFGSLRCELPVTSPFNHD